MRFIFLYSILGLYFFWRAAVPCERLLRYARAWSAHLRPVNSASSHIASLASISQNPAEFFGENI